MKKLAIFVLLLFGCAAATPARDATLVIQRGSVAMRTAIAQNSISEYYKSIEAMRKDYHAIVGESPLFDYWLDQYIEIAKVTEGWRAALARGDDIEPYKLKIETLSNQIREVGPLIRAEIEQAQRDADQRAETNAARLGAIGTVLGALAVGVAAGAAAST